MEPKTPSDGVYFFSILIRYKWLLFIITLLSTIVGLVVSLFVLQVWYASTVNFVPPKESASSSSGSGLSAIMKDFGMSSIGGKQSDEYSMLVMLESRSVIDSIINKYDLIKVYKIDPPLMSETRTEFLSNIKLEYLADGNYELKVWDTNKERAANIANDYVNIANYFADKVLKNELTVNINYFNDRIASIDSIINVKSLELAKIGKDKSMFSPEEQAKAAGTAIASLKGLEMEQQLIYNYYNQLFGEEDARTLNAKELLYAAQTQVNTAFSKPGLIGNFSLSESAPIAVDYLTKYADIEALTKTKALLTTSLEKTILENRTMAHNFFIVDSAIPADKKDKPKRTLIVAGSAVGGFIIGLLIILLANGLKLAHKQVKLINQEKMLND